MNEKLSSKTLDIDNMSKLISDFNVADFLNRDGSEIKVIVANCLRFVDELDEKLKDKLANDADYVKWTGMQASLKTVVKALIPILSSRVDESEVGNLSKVDLMKDADDSTETLDKTYVVSNVVKYSVVPVATYNLLKDTNLDNNAYFYQLLNLLVELSLTNCIRIGKKKLNTIDTDVVLEIINKNYEWNTLLDCLSIDATELNKTLSIPCNARNVLLERCFVDSNIETSIGKPKARQLSLFDDDLVTESVNVISDDAFDPKDLIDDLGVEDLLDNLEGGNADEQE